MVFHGTGELQQFRHDFQGEIVLPSDSEYKQAISRWSVLAEREAGVVTYPKDANDVSLAVKFATSQNLELAVRGELSPNCDCIDADM